MTKATTKQCNPCQVRRNTDYPCPNQAVVEICSTPFCAACARRQEAYFAIGKLTRPLLVQDDLLVQAWWSL